MREFSTRSVAGGLKYREFGSLDTRTKKKLIKLMARISESSYRRGFQHGTLGIHIIDPVTLRFDRSLDKSPYTDTKGGHTSKERLEMEYHVLRQLFVI